METITDTPTPVAADPRPQFEAAARTLCDVVAGIDPGRFDDPTPCSDMSVRQLIDHVGMAVGRVTAAGMRRPLEEWPTEGFTVGDDASSGIRCLVDEACGAWTAERLAEPVQLPWTQLAGADALATYVNEVLVHTWDLATATGQQVEFDAEVLAVAEAIMRRELPVPERGPMWAEFAESMPEGIPFVPPFDDAVSVPGDAPPIVRLVAWNGRDPEV